MSFGQQQIYYAQQQEEYEKFMRGQQTRTYQESAGKKICLQDMQQDQQN